MLTRRVPLRLIQRYPSRTAPRPGRTGHRCESSKAGQSTAPAAAGGSSGAVAGGVAGGVVAVILGYGIYHFSGARSTVNSVEATKQYFKDTLDKTTKSAPEPDQAIQWLRQSTSGYVALIPGAKKYTDAMFDELESLHRQHGKEVDKIVKKTYDDVKKISQEEGVSMQGLSKVWEVLQNTTVEIQKLAGDVSKDILSEHPELKEKLGGKIDDLNKMREQYGPEAKKKVDETWSRIQDILKGGLGASSIEQVRKLIEDATQDMRKASEDAWKQGLEKAKPYLDKNPKVKQVVEQNQERLKSVDWDEVWQQIQEATKTGDTANLEKFVKDKADAAKQSLSSGQSLQDYLKLLPGGQDIGSKLQQLQELGDKHGKEAEQLIKDALTEVKGVLEKKVDEGQKLAEEVKKDAK